MSWRERVVLTILGAFAVALLLAVIANDQVKPPKFGDNPTMQHCFELFGVEYQETSGGLSTCTWRK